MPQEPQQTSGGPRTLAAAKRAAKSLRKALAQAEPSALARFDAVFGGRKDAAAANHADCLHVIAREAGAESWPRLKQAVETAALDREARIAALERAVANGNVGLVDRLLALDATLADTHLGLQLALAQRAPVLAALAAEPALASRPIGRRLPIHHLCYSKVHQRDPALVPVMVELLEALLAAGADVNAGFAAEPGSEHQLTALYGAIGHAGNLPLAAALLRHGADPNDNESLYHATELDSLDGVRLLFAHGAEIGRTNAFYRMLDRESADGVRLFLAHGGDVNAPLYAHPGDDRHDDRNALHHAIIRGRSGDIGRILLEAGADTSATFDGRSPYALAVACGNRSMAQMLEARGLATPLSPAERFLACIADEDAAGARAVRAAHPGLWSTLSAQDLGRPTELAMDAEKLPMLRLMVELGFDPDHKGESDMPPIHAAAWWGHVATVEMYLEIGVELEGVNMFGGTALGTAIHGSVNCPGADQGDYERCVRSLLAAGARIMPDHGHLEMGTDAVTVLVEAAWEEMSAPG